MVKKSKNEVVIANKKKGKEKKNEKEEDDELTTEDIFKLVDLYFNRRNYIYNHLYNSYNKFVEEDIVKWLETSNHVVSESIVGNKSYRYRFQYKNIRVLEPVMENGVEPLYPIDAIRNNLTYEIKITADVTQFQDIIDITSENIETKQMGNTESNIVIANIPLMLRSKWCTLTTHHDVNKECIYNPGGYFIVNGQEKVIISQDRIVENKALVLSKKDSGIVTYMAQVHSRSYRPHGSSQVVKIKGKKDGILNLIVPILNEVNVFIVMRALGLETDKNIIDYCVYDKNKDMLDFISSGLNKCIDENGRKIQTRDEAIDFLLPKMRVTKKYTETDKDIKILQKKSHLMYLFKNSFLSHVEGSLIKKAIYLGLMVNKLIKVMMGQCPADERDTYVNKRVDLPGDLLFDLFRQFYKKMMSDLKKFFESKTNGNHDSPYNIISSIKPNTIGQGMKAALSTGRWIKKSGVAQVLPRLTFLQTISYLRRIDAQSGDASTNKLTAPRQLHQSSTGFLCPTQSPEHTRIGLTKHLSIIGSITIMSYDQFLIIREYLMNNVIDICDFDSQLFEDQSIYKVFLNGDWLGMTKSIDTLNNELNEKRINGDFDQKCISIVCDHENGELRVYCDSGRLYRPIIRVENNELMLKKEHIDNISIDTIDITNKKITNWNEFTVRYPNVIDYIDMELQPYLLLAHSREALKEARDKMNKSIQKVDDVTDNHVANRYDDLYFVKYTHCEIHSSLLCGEVVANVPLFEHNQSTRNIFLYAQGRQAMGIYATNYRERLDLSYILYHPQRPLVSTRICKYLNTEALPAGENCIVAIGCYTGFNQEDSLVLNKTSIERGKFRATSLKKYMTMVNKNVTTSQDDIFMKPESSKVIGMKSGTYDKLNEHGYVKEETSVDNGDIIIGKVSPLQEMIGGKQYRDSSETYKSNVTGVVDRVYPNIQDQNGYGMIKILVRSERIPKIGDKYCCFDKFTEILTKNRGWINMADLKSNDLIACLENNKLIYKQPTEVIEYDCCDCMYCIASDKVNLMVTLNHRMYVSDSLEEDFTIKTANVIEGKTVYYKKNIESGNGETIADGKIIVLENGKYVFVLTGYDDLPELKLDLDTWLTFFGIIITNNINNPNVKKEFIECDKKLNLGFYNDKDDTFMFYNCDKRLKSYMEKINVNEDLPEWALNLGCEHSKKLITSIFLNTSENYCIPKTKKFADSLQILCLHAGWSADIIVKDKEQQIIINKENKIIVNKTKKEDNIVYYKGKIYCCAVEGDGVIYVRRNNIPVWSGNSRCGQKGSIGLTITSENLPFTEEGIQPDFIINPCGFPKRMPVGQLIECMIGKIASVKGIEMDGTSFEKVDIDSLRKMLKELGYQEDGCEYMYNGMTGEKIKTAIFIGPTFYLRLKHLVDDKIHSRARGPRLLLTRQPPEGRARDGGLRLGEMERDALCAHGLSKFIKEKFLDNSDIYETYVCDLCGLFAQRLQRNDNEDIYFCKSCQNYTEISKIVIPYAFKLFLQELMALNIAPRIRTEKFI